MPDVTASSKLTCMLPIWGGATDTLINSLIVLQNRVIKEIKVLPYLTPSITLYNERILPLKTQYLFEIILLIFKLKNNLLKCNLYLPIVSQIHNYSTRQQYDFYISNSIRTNRGQNNIFYRGLVLYNTIPRNLQNLSITNFKIEVKKLLFHNYIC